MSMRNFFSRKSVRDLNHLQEQQVKVTLRLERLLQVPSSGSRTFYFVKAKSANIRSKFSSTSELATLNKNTPTVVFDHSVQFDCSFSWSPQGKPAPVLIRVSIRITDSKSCKSFKRLGIVHINIAKYFEHLGSGLFVKDKELLENCPFNSLLQFSLKIDSDDDSPSFVGTPSSLDTNSVHLRSCSSSEIKSVLLF